MFANKTIDVNIISEKIGRNFFLLHAHSGHE